MRPGARRLSGWVIAGLLALSSSAVLISQSAATVHASAPRAALPSSRLEFGLSNFDGSWMTSSGVPWKYRFQYLSAGVNTLKGWETWQDPAMPPGQFALDYMTSSTTSPASYIPVFTYYELLQSLPSTGASELDRDYSNLNNAATMSAYYANFKLLMQKAAQYGKQVVVHVEPDFWGYMQQKAAGGDATTVSAKVKSSGFPEASAFPDSVSGFASELKYLRDTYAPNALLAMHASMWSSGVDIASNTDPNVNATGEADKTAAFLNSAGAGSWDVVFNDVDDHDAAWWELASCGSPPCVNQYFTHWWDPANVRFPNFARYLAWVGELRSVTGRPQVVWQVPMGNQYFLTMNNTCGHYQDNVAPYFTAHASDLFNAGLVAVLFGAGNHCQTANDDSNKDGITNNKAVPTTDLLGGCSACNVHPSNWSDDDGGYLRIFVGLYYSGQSACSSATVAALPLSPQPQGVHVQLTAVASGCANPLYELWIQSPGGAWTLTQPYSANAVWTWDTTGLVPGTYTIHAWATGSGGDLTTWQAFGELKFLVQAQAGCSSTSLSPPNPTQAAGTAFGFTASSSGCLNPVYEFWVRYPGGMWYLKQSWGPSNSFSWSTVGLPPGVYTVHAWASRSATTREAIGSATATLTGCMSASVTPSPASQPAGSTIAFTASSSNCPGPQYEYWAQYPGGVWHLLRGWGAAAFSWSTAGLAPGLYTVHVWVNNQGTGHDDIGTSNVTLTGCTSASVSTSASGAMITFTATASPCPNPVFEFWLLDPSGVWHKMQDFSPASTWTWSSTGWAKGTYTIHAWSNQQGASTGTYETIGSAIYALT